MTIIKTCSLALILAAGLMAGCSKSLENSPVSAASFLDITPAPETPDIIPPEVSSHSPTGEEISLTTKITVRFNELMNQGSVTSATFLVTAGGVGVAGRVSYSSLTRTYTFTPDTSLSNLTDYTVTIVGGTSGVSDRAGNSMAADYTWTFSTLDAGTLPAPGFSPPDGTYDSDTVTITYSGPPANIYYTTNETDPSPSNGTLYDGNPIPITVNTQIRAIACENAGYYDSAIATGNFYFHTDRPTLNYAGGTYHADISVEITPPSLDPFAMIFYEMTIGTQAAPPADPPLPTISSPGYTGPLPVAGDFTMVKIRAIAVSTGKSDSLPVDATYTIDYYQVGRPAFSVAPSAGPFDTPQSVTVSHEAGSTLIYTLDGSDPTDPMNPNIQTDINDPVIAVDDTMTINAYAVMSGWRDSAVESGTFIINPAIASIIPGAASSSETGLSLTISGQRFKSGGSVTLSYGASQLTPLSSTLAGDTMINCTFDLTGATPAYWSVTVANPDTGTATLVDGFRVYEDPAGTVSWWKLDGNADDYYGTNNGSPFGTISYTADRFGVSGRAASNGSVTNYIQAPATGLPVSAAPRTMMGWFRVDSFNAVDSFLFGYGSSTKYFKLYINSIGNRLVAADGTAIITGTTAIQTGRWYHAAVTYDGTTAKLYLDGMLEGTATETLATNASGTMYLFKAGSFTPYLAGALDDVTVLDSALAQAEIQEAAAGGAYLLPPTNLSPSRGTYVNQIAVTWDPVLDATSYDVWRSTGLTMTYSEIAAGVTEASYTDTSITPGIIYYYKVRAKNAAMTSDLTKAEAGFTYGTLTTLTEGFEWVFAGWWDISPAQPVLAGLTTPSFGTNPAQYDGNSQMTVSSATTCTGGCGFGESLALTTTFGAPINYFTLSLYYIYSPGANVGGNFSVYVNNPDPSDDPENGLAPFAQELKTGGWWQRTLYYMGDNDINSVTIIFYDITDTATFSVDLLRLNYK